MPQWISQTAAMRRPSRTLSGAEPSAGPVGHMPASAPGVCRAAGLHALGVERCCRAGKRAVIEGPSPVHRKPTHGFTRRRWAAAQRSDVGVARMRPDMDANRREPDGMGL